MATPSRISVLRPVGGGISQMRKVLTRFGEAVERDSEIVIADLADHIQREAIKRAPKQTGNLESAIKQRQGGRGNKSLIVYVDEAQAPYAKWMHQGMFDFFADGKYFLGPGSQAKSTGQAHEEPGGVGVLFLERGATAAIAQHSRPRWQRHLSQMAAKIAAFGRLFLR